MGHEDGLIGFRGTPRIMVHPPPVFSFINFFGFENVRLTHFRIDVGDWTTDRCVGHLDYYFQVDLHHHDEMSEWDIACT